MYQHASPEYLIQMYNKATRRRLTGTIGGVAFTGADVIRGSFEATNRCAEQSEMKIGGVYIGQLNMTFTPSFLTKIARRNYIGQEIIAYIGLKVGNAWEDIPLGVYTVTSADVSKEGVAVEAYDHMKKLDKAWPYSTTYGKIYDLLSLIANDCGVGLGISRSTTERMPNGTEELYLSEENDIETYRDLLYWTAQTAGGFATMDRDGNLTLRHFGMSTTEMDETERDIDAVFSDYITKWTGLSIEDIKEGETEYYNIIPDDGLTMNLGKNPLLQTLADEGTQEAIAYLETQITNTENQILGVEDEIATIEDDLAEVEAELREHPDDPELLAEKARLETAKHIKEDEERMLEDQKQAYEKELDDLRHGLIDRSKVFREKACRKILAEIATIQYMPFAINSARDPIFDLGDLIYFTGGLSGEATGCIMGWAYNIDNFAFYGYGDNPALTDSRSKTDKSVTGLSKKDKDKANLTDFVYFTNAAPISIPEGHEVEIGLLKFGLEKDADAETWIELKLESTKNASRKAGIRLHYYLDGQEVEGYHPEEEWLDLYTPITITERGTTLVINTTGQNSQNSQSEPEQIQAGETADIHTINYQYHLTNLPATTYHTWRVTAEGTAGLQEIATGDAHIVVWAQGLQGEGKFIGLLEAEDQIPFLDFDTLEIWGELQDEVILSTSGGESETITTEDDDDLTTEDDDDLTTE